MMVVVVVCCGESEKGWGVLLFVVYSSRESSTYKVVNFQAGIEGVRGSGIVRG
jgi:hypothetical protein